MLLGVRSMWGLVRSVLGVRGGRFRAGELLCVMRVHWVMGLVSSGVS